jgi:hypothetical protein
MKDNIKRIIAESVFCYACPDGQGYVNKKDCPCYGTGQQDCEAANEMRSFHRQYAAIHGSCPSLSRDEVVAIIAKQYEGKETKWFHQNVRQVQDKD